MDDLIEGAVRMMENTRGFIGPVNLGNPGEFTILELARKVLAMIPESSSRLVFRPLPADDPKQRCPDIALAAQELDWRPRVPLEEGLRRTIQYFRKALAEQSPVESL